MKRGRFTDEKIVRILQEADKAPVAEVAKRHGVSEPSIVALEIFIFRRLSVGG